MDPWASPWTDDNDDPPPVAADTSTSSQLHARYDLNPAAVVAPSLPSLPVESSDPWSKDDSVQLPSHLNLPPSTPISLQPAEKPPALSKLPSSLFSSASPWNDGADYDPPTLLHSSKNEPFTPNEHHRPASFDLSRAEVDPWSSTPQNAITLPLAAAPAEERLSKPFGSASLAESEPTSEHAQSWHGGNEGWASSALSPTLPSTATASETVARFGGSEAATQGLDADGHDTAVGKELEDDVWAAAAAQKKKKERQLPSHEVDMLKLEARRMVFAPNDVEALAATFKMDFAGDEGWESLFGKQGSKAGILRDLEQMPSGASRHDGISVGPMSSNAQSTSAQARDAVRKTEGKGVKLAAPEGSSSWKRRSRMLPKPDWDMDGTRDQLTSSDPISVSRQSLDQDSKSKAGPGWYLTTSKDNRQSSGGSLFANLFKIRQVSSSSVQSPNLSNPSSSPRASMEQAPRASYERPTCSAQTLGTSASETSDEQSRQEPTSVYTDDSAGPDLMQLGSATNQATSLPDTNAKVASKPSILSRWTTRQLFGSKSARPNTGLAESSGFNEDDLDWLDSKSGTQSGAVDENGSHDDGFDAFDVRSISSSVQPRFHRFNKQFGNLMDDDDDDDYTFNGVSASTTQSRSAQTAAASAETSLGLVKQPGSKQGVPSRDGDRPDVVQSTSGWKALEWDLAPEPSQRNIPLGHHGTTSSPKPQECMGNSTVAASNSAYLPHIRPPLKGDDYMSRAAPRLPPPPASHRTSLPPPASQPASLPPPPCATRSPESDKQSQTSAANSLLFSDFVTTTDSRQPGPAIAPTLAPAPRSGTPQLSQGKALTADDLSFFDSL
ncbi:hypothetical protein ACQY0O_006207 [Thecaphora frezii]